MGNTGGLASRSYRLLVYLAVSMAILIAGSTIGTADAGNHDLATARVTANVRAEPSAAAERVGQLVEGRRVRVLAAVEAGEWLQVAELDGTPLGFVAARLLDRHATAPVELSGGSIFTEIAQSGAIEAAHEERRQREREARLRQDEQERLDLERSRLEYERRQDEIDREWEERRRARDAEQRRFLERGQSGTNPLDDLAQRMAQGLMSAPPVPQAQTSPGQQRQQPQARSAPNPQTRSAPTARSSTPVQQPRPSSPSPSVTRAARPNSCWYVPDGGQASCVAVSTSWDDGRQIIEVRNTCSKRIVVRACGGRQGKSDYCAMEAISPGRTWRHWVPARENPSGTHRTEWAGSDTGADDWDCLRRR